MSKDEFVDKYPYLVYTGENDMSTDDISGGGTGELQPATTETLGGVIVGDGLSVTEQGVLSASGGGGSENLVIHVTAGEDDTLVTDTSYSEIESAIANGKFIYLIDTSMEPQVYYAYFTSTMSLDSDESAYAFTTNGALVGNNSFTFTYVIAENSDEVTVLEYFSVAEE